MNTKKMYEDFLKDFGDSVLATDRKVYKNLYFDLPILKDTRLGLMIALISQSQDSNKWIEYIRSNLKNYVIRPYRDFKDTAYPELPYSEQDLRIAYRDVRNSSMIFDYSPDTTILCGIKDFLSTLVDRNRGNGYRDVINITANTFPHEPTELHGVWSRIMSQYLQPINCRFSLICKNPTTISAEQWESYQYIYLDDLSVVTSVDTPFIHCLSERYSFMNTDILTPFCASKDVLKDMELDDLDPTDLASITKTMGDTEDMMRLASMFSFLQPSFPELESI